MKTYHSGFNLVELLSSLAITSIIATSVAPSLSHMLDKQRSNLTINSLAKLINVARQQAISGSTYTTLCPSQDLITCTDNWQQQLILFTDENKNEIIDKNDSLIQISAITTKQYGYLALRTSGKAYLQFNPRGYTNGKWGNITYCASNKAPNLARRIVINRTGRIRHEIDTNNDGVINTTTPLICN